MPKNQTKTEQLQSLAAETAAHTRHIRSSLTRIQAWGEELGKRSLTRLALPTARLYHAMAAVADSFYGVVADVVEAAAKVEPEEGLTVEEAITGVTEVVGALTILDPTEKEEEPPVTTSPVAQA